MLFALILSARLLAASGDWAAFDRGETCEAMSRSLPAPRQGDEQPHIAISFDRTGRRHGEANVRLRRAARSGSSVIVPVGDQPFLLPARGPDAWSRGPGQEAAIIAAIRVATSMRVEARDRPPAEGRRRTRLVAHLPQSMLPPPPALADARNFATFALHGLPSMSADYRFDVDPRTGRSTSHAAAAVPRADGRVELIGLPRDGICAALTSAGLDPSRPSSAPSKSGTGSTTAESAISRR